MGRAGMMLIGLVALLAGAPARAAVPARHAMVVAAQRLAAAAGLAMLRQGGNAIDAAVASAWAEAVVDPCCGNIGGGGFMVIHLAHGRMVFLDFRETAPAAARANMYLDASGRVVPGASLHGYLAVAVPGTVLGLETARRRWGRLSRAAVMAPAIRLAREGFVLGPADVAILRYGTRTFRTQPDIARRFLGTDGRPLRAGARLVQPELARTLEAIAAGGARAFYHGRIPREIARASRAGGGILTTADFARYRVGIGRPLACSYRGWRLYSAPPPSSGGVSMCEILGVLAGYDMRALGFHSARAVHVMAEAMRNAFRDRNTALGDPAFVHNPIARLLSPAHLAAIRARILPDRATPSRDLPAPSASREKPQTTQISTIDAAGNAVSLTYTLNGFFGAGVMAGDTGFFLNDEMDDFTSKPGVPNMFGLVQGRANAIAPGKRPLSSMAPTIVMRHGRVFLVLGSPGGSRIITITLEAAMNVIDYGMGPQAAVDAPRFHEQWLPDVIFAEPGAFSAHVVRRLSRMGYRLRIGGQWGAAEMIEVTPQGFLGANDRRRPAGAALGF